MKIIDAHTHVFPDPLAPRAIQALADPGRHNPHYDATLPGLLDKMAEAGVGHAITLPVATRPGQVETINEFAARQPRHLVTPFGGIHPDLDDPAAVLRTFPALGLAGFKFHPDYQECAPDDPRMAPILETAQELGLIAYFHAGWDVGPTTCFGTPEAFARTLDRYPDLTVALAHFGGYRCWDEVEELLVGRDVYFDTSYTFADIEREQFIRMVDAHGHDHVMFGSDGPWTDPVENIAYIRDCGFSDERLEWILHRSAEAMLARSSVPTEAVPTP